MGRSDGGLSQGVRPVTGQDDRLCDNQAPCPPHRAYDDRLAGKITDELWSRKSAEWESELATLRQETGRHEHASHDYAVTGSRILELAKNAYHRFIQQNSTEQARLLRTVVSNCTFDRGTLQRLTLSRSTCSSKAMKRAIGWEVGIRTPITTSRAWCPTVERPPSI